MIDQCDIPISGSYHDCGYCIDGFQTSGGEDEVIREQCKNALRRMSTCSSLFENIDANQIISDDSEQPVIEFRQSEGMNYVFAQVLPFCLVPQCFSFFH